jgi:hypothetical protein
VIARKLEYPREGRSPKHLSDIRGVLRHSSTEIDFERLEQIIDELGVRAEWEQAKSGDWTM